MNEVASYNEQTFEGIKHIDENGMEFWYARELQKALEYTEYGKFTPVIDKAIESCKKSGVNADDHFAHVSEMVKIGSGAERQIESFKLTRYACYLIVMNGDPRKEVIALGQTYFAVFLNGGYQELKIYFDVGTKVRKTIEELGGTMPEDLPTPDKGIKQIEKEQKKVEERI